MMRRCFTMVNPSTSASMYFCKNIDDTPKFYIIVNSSTSAWSFIAKTSMAHRCFISGLISAQVHQCIIPQLIPAQVHQYFIGKILTRFYTLINPSTNALMFQCKNIDIDVSVIRYGCHILNFQLENIDVPENQRLGHFKKNRGQICNLFFLGDMNKNFVGYRMCCVFLMKHKHEAAATFYQKI